MLSFPFSNFNEVLGSRERQSRRATTLFSLIICRQLDSTTLESGEEGQDHEPLFGQSADIIDALEPAVTQLRSAHQAGRLAALRPITGTL